MSVIKLTGDSIRLKDLVTKPAKKPKDTKETIHRLQFSLLRVQQAIFREKRRVIILIEGTDTAGKGGVIRRLTRHLDPRGVRVWPIGAPDKSEQARHYLYRFWQKIPQPGEITIMDRSWYGRVLVERVEGFAEKPEWKRAYRELLEFERQLADDGVIILKFYLHLSKKEQLKRFMDRVKEPTKRWKLTTSDLESRQYWDQYQEAYEDMLNKTAADFAPWYAIPADNKDYARTQILTQIDKELSRMVNLKNIRILDAKVRTKLIEAFGEDTILDLLGESAVAKST
ncbi:polyphosphate kinase [Ketobacter sp. MCCC 1A13808]|uniref:polyphosphate kinase 2 family protein n=1 Tax=Ketobacter sp. MCCC 1A13808 TaxID=2602738 RepID=UPI000F2B6934|nr:polyphosphate kinase [Ketobacter sp. MCCC 1A13808]MVF10871.1 polyphosphate kinase [Ketobacter sp. MCCC 1A13808]RLP56268.1 MAG: polyphosphate kinase [Ketobacter sp.]